MILTPQELYDIFVHRKDVFSVQQKTGAYFPIKRSITIKDLEKHLAGEITIGVYCLDTNNTVKWGCVDIDGDKHLTPKANKKLQYPKSLLIYNLFPEFPRMLEWSGRKGYHVWIFFKKPVLAAYVKKLITARLRRVKIYGIEVFPKQITLNENRKYGNLVKIPNSKHQVSGIQSEIIKIEGVL